MNKTKWHQCLSVLVPKSIGLWLSFSVIFAFYPSLINTGIQRNGEPKRMIPLAYPTIKHFPKGTLAWLLPSQDGIASEVLEGKGRLLFSYVCLMSTLRLGTKLTFSNFFF